MMFRTIPARWFECLTARDDLTLAVETLAHTHKVELETQSEAHTRVILPDLREGLSRYHQLAQRFQNYWPEGQHVSSQPPQRPVERLNHALERLEQWRQEAEASITEIENLQGDQGQMHLWHELLEVLAHGQLNLQLLTQTGPALALQVYALPQKSRPVSQPGAVIAEVIGTPEHSFIIVLGPPQEVESLEQSFLAQKGRRLIIPAWFKDDAQQTLAELEAHRRQNLERIQQQENRLNVLVETHQLRQALGDIERIEWFVTHVDQLPVSDNFAWVTGWTNDVEGKELQQALEKSGVRVILRFPQPPRGLTSPMVMQNPWWAQPFELFTNMLGTPAHDEADPSRLLVFIVPLLFGYMFGDLGQGFVLFLVGMALRNRYPSLRLLIPAGLASMGFGLLFGSVFCREDIIPALWLHPIDEPLTILIIPLIGGGLLLLLGLLLNGIEAYWRHHLWQWLQQDAAMLAIYLGLLGAMFYPYAILASVLGLVWYLLAQLITSQANLRALPGAMGRLIEYTFQLLINTLSFTRVGAFALAHAGLSIAIIGLAEASGHVLFYGVILVLGNLLILVLEGLVVSIQITRLVLFEFFIRFLRGEGRRFHPLEAPPP